MRLLTIISSLLLTINLLVFSGCFTLTTVELTGSLVQSSYTLPQGDVQRITTNDVSMEVEVLDRSKMTQNPELFAFDPTWLPGYPKAYVNLYHYYPYSNGVSWSYLFGTPDGSFNFPAFLVTIRNNSGQILNLRNTYAFLTIESSYNVPPVSNADQFKQMLREMELAFEHRPSTSFITLRWEYPVGVLPQLVELKRPYFRFLDPRALILPGQEYTFLAVFPADFPRTATLSFFGIPTKLSSAGDVLERNNFQFEIVKRQTGSVSQR